MFIDTEDKKELARWTWEAITAAMDDAKESGNYTANKIWYEGTEILCDTEGRAEAIADFLEALGFNYVSTGYYDPVEDERNDDVGLYTGWYYVNFD